MAISTSAVAQQTASQINSAQSLLGKDDFLKLLLTQLRYQDPLNPMDGTEFATQLAQFSSVEQLSNISAGITESLDANQLLTQAIGNALSVTVIGKEIKASGEEFVYSGTGDIRLGYSLPSAAGGVVMKIQDSSGNTVRTFVNPGVAKGDNEVKWDGTDSQGLAVAAGTYKLVVQATGNDGETLSATPFIYGHVTAVRFKSSGTVFVVDGIEIPVAKVLEIFNG